MKVNCINVQAGSDATAAHRWQDTLAKFNDWVGWLEEHGADIESADVDNYGSATIEVSPDDPFLEQIALWVADDIHYTLMTTCRQCGGWQAIAANRGSCARCRQDP